jgi:hypothetical protein
MSIEHGAFRIKPFIKADPDFDYSLKNYVFTEEDKKSEASRRAKVLHWADIQTASKTATEFELRAKECMLQFLGYNPHPYDYYPHLPFIQTVIDNYMKRQIPAKTANAELLFHMKAIRNKQMLSGGWLRFLERTPEEYAYYARVLPKMAVSARLRLCQLLGYEPDIVHSMDAEIYLRHVYCRDDFYEDMPFSQEDYLAATVTRYCQLYLTEGKAAADDSGLLGPYNFGQLFPTENPQTQ